MGNTDQKEQRKKSKSDSLDVSPKKNILGFIPIPEILRKESSSSSSKTQLDPESMDVSLLIDFYRKKKLSLYSNLPKTRSSVLENRLVLYQSKIVSDLTRSQITSLCNRYYSMVGLVQVSCQITKQGESGPEVSYSIFWGTGTLVAPNLVITAGHVTDAKSLKNAKITSMTFAPGASSEASSPFGVIKVKEWFTSPGYNTQYWNISKPGTDIAVLVLEEAVGFKTGFVNCKACKDKELKSLNIMITGYPENAAEREKLIKESATFTKDKDIYPNFVPFLFRVGGKINEVINGILRYQISTAVSQSGSAVIEIEDDDSYNIIGIHCETTSGTRISNDIVRWIEFLKTKYPPIEDTSFIQLKASVSDEVMRLSQVLQDAFQIDEKNLYPLFEIGSGALGTIQRVHDSRTGKSFALKIIEFENEVQEAETLRELQVMIKLIVHCRYPKLSKVFKIRYEPGKYAKILMEIGIGTLHSYNEFRKLIDVNFTREELSHIAHQLLVQIYLLKSSSIHHRDIKPSNILVTKDMNLKLTDFGIADFIISKDSEFGDYKVSGTEEFCAKIIKDGFKDDSGIIHINPFECEKESIYKVIKSLHYEKPLNIVEAKVLVDEQDEKIIKHLSEKNIISLTSDPILPTDDAKYNQFLDFEHFTIIENTSETNMKTLMNYVERLCSKEQSDRWIDIIEKKYSSQRNSRLVTVIEIQKAKVNVLFKLGKYAECLSFMEKITDLKKYDNFVEIKGLCLMKTGSIDFAEEFFTTTLKEGTLENSFRERIYCVLGWINYLTHKHKAALDYYNQALKRFEKNPSNTKLSIIKYHLMIAIQYYCLKDTKAVAEQLDRCFEVMQIYTKEKGVDFFDFVHNKLAILREEFSFKTDPSDIFLQVYQYTGLFADNFKEHEEYQKAFYFYELGLIHVRECLDEFSTTVADCYFQIAQVAHRAQKFELALAIFKKCLEIRLKLAGTNHQMLEETYIELGKLYIDVKNWTEAQEALNKCLEERVKIAGEENIKVEEVYEYLAGVEFELKNNGVALKYAGKALEIVEKVKKDDIEKVKALKQLIEKIVKNLANTS